jgi:hypothetical protein
MSFDSVGKLAFAVCADVSIALGYRAAGGW